MLISLIRGMLRKPGQQIRPDAEDRAHPAGTARDLHATNLNTRRDEDRALLEDAYAAIEHGRLEDSIVNLRRATTGEPDDANRFLARARVARELGLFDEAVYALGVARELLPNAVEIVHSLGTAHEAAGDLLKAQTCYQDAIAQHPDFFAAHLNLGNVRRSLGDLAGAASAYEHALRLRPDSAKAHGNLANLLKLRGVLVPAEEHFRRAMELDPSELRWLFGLAATLHDLERLDDAIAIYREILAREPGDEKAAHNLAYALLGRGDFAFGWAGTESRFELTQGAVARHPCPAPPWHGEPISAGTLLVWGEQGVGDEILFAGMYPDLMQRCGTMILECQPKLRSLFARSFPWAQVVAKAEPAAECCTVGVDRQIAAGSLGAILRTSLESFPSRRGYLLADSARVAYWRTRLAALGDGAKIGFCWRSSNMQGERALSCSRIEQWQALFRLTGVHWICLQYDDCTAELDSARSRFDAELHRFHDVDYFDDLDEVAALTSALDLVITAPTTVSILAAALGVETWQFSFGLDWQTHGTSANPWLPALRRFPRAWSERWEDVLGKMAQELAHRR